mmetsp:Transcript_35447/g.114182  ORF Transcript_35447/g.114182 Transcript_35447/m.114182 type:complete len:292 (+) Transcript_35447:2247-3122(+)
MGRPLPRRVETPGHLSGARLGRTGQCAGHGGERARQIPSGGAQEGVLHARRLVGRSGRSGPGQAATIGRLGAGPPPPPRAQAVDSQRGGRSTIGRYALGPVGVDQPAAAPVPHLAGGDRADGQHVRAHYSGHHAAPAHPGRARARLHVGRVDHQRARHRGVQQPVAAHRARAQLVGKPSAGQGVPERSGVQDVWVPVHQLLLHLLLPRLLPPARGRPVWLLRLLRRRVRVHGAAPHPAAGDACAQHRAGRLSGNVPAGPQVRGQEAQRLHQQPAQAEEGLRHARGRVGGRA